MNQSILEPLPDTTCHELLADQQVGRIAWQSASGLQLLPISYRWINGRVVFRTTPDGALSELVGPREVIFEIDHLDTASRRGWSIVVHGLSGPAASLVDEVADNAWTDSVPWIGGKRTLAIAITPSRVTGRTIRRPESR